MILSLPVCSGRHGHTGTDSRRQSPIYVLQDNVFCVYLLCQPCDRRPAQPSPAQSSPTRGWTLPTADPHRRDSAFRRDRLSRLSQASLRINESLLPELLHGQSGLCRQWLTASPATVLGKVHRQFPWPAGTEQQPVVADPPGVPGFEAPVRSAGDGIDAGVSDPMQQTGFLPASGINEGYTIC